MMRPRLLKNLKNFRRYSTTSLNPPDHPHLPDNVLPRQSCRIIEQDISFFSPEVLKIIQAKFDFSKGSIARYFKRAIVDHSIKDQAINQEMLATLGKNLCAAHFVVSRRGSVKFLGEVKWTRLKPPTELTKEEQLDQYQHILPNKNVPGLFVEAINMEGINIFYEGLTHLEGLKKLRWLSFKNCKNFDDWCMDHISGMLADQLEYLDLSGTSITPRALSSFYRFNSLKTLKLYDIPVTDDLKLSCLMLEEENPNLEIEGN